MTLKERINQRFTKDFNLPINIFNDRIFEYYHNLYDFWPEEEWVALSKEIEENYGGNMDIWLEHYAQTRDLIIRELESSTVYQEFNNRDMNSFKIEGRLRNIPDQNIYNESCDGKIFVSIDLRKANFQALKYVGVIKEDTYDDFIDKYDKSFYFKKSKYTRQVIFGKLNPKRTITVEHYLMGEIAKIKFPAIDNVYGNLVAFKSDELIWEVEGIVLENELKNIETTVKNTLGLDIKAECFLIKRLPIVNANGNKVSAYIKRNVNSGEEILKSASTTYYPQIYKIWKGYVIADIDLMFYHEDQLAKFIEPLKIEEK